jgi:hypothetical protein
MKCINWICLPLAILLLAGCGKNTAPRSEVPEIRALVDGILMEYGGEEAMRRVTGYQAEGMLHTTRGQITAVTRRWFRRPDCLLLEVAYPRGPEWRLTRGNLGWDGPAEGDWKPANPPRIWPMRLQTVRFDLPLRLRENEAALQLMARDGQNRPVLRLTIDQGLHMEYHIDPASHRVMSVNMIMEGPPAMVFQADYGDFKLVDGILFPHHEVTWARGTVTSSINIKSIIINPENLDERVAQPRKVSGEGVI